mmetsp:Transcript_31029/g.40992  ORF Transcript_31029/g.40992 Transcript_31029/m.40992 type:complete len:96 (+) Transcript_31029:1545-1832(+)
MQGIWEILSKITSHKFHSESLRLYKCATVQLKAKLKRVAIDDSIFFFATIQLIESRFETIQMTLDISFIYFLQQVWQIKGDEVQLSNKGKLLYQR